MIAGLLGLLIPVGSAAAADKELKGKLESVDVKKMTLVVVVEDRKVT